MFHTLRLSLAIPWHVIKALFEVVRTPRFFVLAAVPATIGVITFFTTIVLSIVYRSEVSTLVGLQPDSIWHTATSWAFALLAILPATIFAYCSASILGIFSTDALVNRFLIHYQLKQKTEKNNFSWLTLLYSILQEIIFISILGLCAFIAFITSFIPPLALLSMLLGLFVLGASFFNTALALLNLNLLRRARLLAKLTIPSLTLGAIFGFCLVVPLLGIILLPVFSAAAVVTLSKANIVQN